MNASTKPVVIVGGGQSGLAAAHALRDTGLRPLILESGTRPVGSWPRYYDSLTLFSPARHSAMPGAPFPGDPDHYPHRDEVTDYLQRYAGTLDVEIRTGSRVNAVDAADGGFVVHTTAGDSIRAAGLVAASGSFGNPHIPVLPGHEQFTGELLHVADYRDPTPYAGRRVIVVGAGNSAIQVGYELAQVAKVTIATRAPIRFAPQRVLGHDAHHWLTTTGFDRLPRKWLLRILRHTPVQDPGVYREALESGLLRRRPMFTAWAGDRVTWADDTREPADVVVFATGYRPDLDYLKPLGALNPDGTPAHTGGVSTTHPGLVYVGLEFQRSFASNTLRGVHRDAEFVTAALTAHIRRARFTLRAETR